MAVSFATNIRPMFTDMDIAHMKNFGLHRQTRADSDPNGLDDPTEPGTEPFRV